VVSGQAVLYVNPTAIHGGAEEVLLRIMSYARELGYRPVLVVPSAGWLTSECAQLGIPCELLPTLPDTMASETWQEQFGPWIPNALAISRLARKWRVVVVHSNTPRASYHGGLGARLAGVAAVTHVHDIVSLPYRSPIKGRLLSALADRTLVVSRAVEDAVTGFAPRLRSRIQTLYNGWDVASYAGVQPADLRALFGVPADAVVVGTVAALTPWKGQDILIDAFRHLRERVAAAHLVIVGGTQGGKAQAAYEVELHRRVAEYGLGDAVTFTGWREDVWALIRAFDIFAHVPTQPDPLPTSVLHACALSRAVVASHIGGVPEIVLDGVGGVLVPAGDAAALARALEELAADPRRRAALGQQAYEHFVARFSRQQMVDGLGQIYSQCISRKRAIGEA
jgi:glycosyltransferase involved in cell wall biosynthesis